MTIFVKKISVHRTGAIYLVYGSTLRAWSIIKSSPLSLKFAKC
jgi:hypothetical protein